MITKKEEVDTKKRRMRTKPFKNGRITLGEIRKAVNANGKKV